MGSQSLVLYVLIVSCEAAFWVVLLLSLVVRYVLHREAQSRWLLLLLPLIDVLLLVFTALDLKAGTTATMAHGLAAVYVGFTIAFGSIMVQWADARFAHRFASGTVPTRAPTVGWKVVRYDFMLWLRCIAAWLIAFALLEGLIAFIDDESITQPLRAWYMNGFGCVFFWFLFGPAWSLVFFRRQPHDA